MDSIHPTIQLDTSRTLLALGSYGKAKGTATSPRLHLIDLPEADGTVRSVISVANIPKKTIVWNAFKRRNQDWYGRFHKSSRSELAVRIARSLTNLETIHDQKIVRDGLKGLEQFANSLSKSKRWKQETILIRDRISQLSKKLESFSLELSTFTQFSSFAPQSDAEIIMVDEDDGSDVIGMRGIALEVAQARTKSTLDSLIRDRSTYVRNHYKHIDHPVCVRALAKFDQDIARASEMTHTKPTDSCII